ncbi:UNVERIFIED_CONTAM: hypothetical protein FKN15_032234 [Acipenser sinensis]
MSLACFKRFTLLACGDGERLRGAWDVQQGILGQFMEEGLRGSKSRRRFGHRGRGTHPRGPHQPVLPYPGLKGESGMLAAQAPHTEGAGDPTLDTTCSSDGWWSDVTAEEGRRNKKTSGYPLTWPLPPSGIISQVSSTSSSSIPPPCSFQSRRSTLESRILLSIKTTNLIGISSFLAISLLHIDLTQVPGNNFLLFIRTSKTDSYIKIQKFHNLVPGADPNPRLVRLFSKTIFN